MMLFGTPVMVFDDLMPEEYRLDILEVAKDIKENTPDDNKHWFCDVYSTCHDLDLYTLEEFEPLLTTQTEKCHRFLAEHGVAKNLHPTGSWLNAYTSKQFQDMHKHPNVEVSCVYFLDAPEGSAPLTFHNPVIPDLFMGPYTTDHLIERKDIKAVSNRLVTFLSWTWHSVRQGTNENMRWSIASNYKVIDD